MARHQGTRRGSSVPKFVVPDAGDDALIEGRQHLLSDGEALLCNLPFELIERLPDTKPVRPRLRALARVRQPQAPRPADGAQGAPAG
jgi:hypothetical protein